MTLITKLGIVIALLSERLSYVFFKGHTIDFFVKHNLTCEHEPRKIIELVCLYLKNILCKFLMDVSKNRVSLMIKTNPMWSESVLHLLPVYTLDQIQLVHYFLHSEASSHLSCLLQPILEILEDSHQNIRRVTLLVFQRHEIKLLHVKLCERFPPFQ